MPDRQEETKESSAGSAPAHEAYSVKNHTVAAAAVIFLMVVGCGYWAAKANLAGAVIGSGTVVVERNLKKIQHMYGGIVATIDVREGDRVQVGQRLVRLDDTQAKSEFAILQSQIVELMARQSRLLAERDELQRVEFEKAGATLTDEEARVHRSELRLFEENRRTRAMQKEQLEARTRQLDEEIAALVHQQTARHREIAINTSEISTVRQLHERQLTSVNRVYALERESSRLFGEHGALGAQIARARGQMSELRLQMISLDQNARTEAQRELRTVEARLAELNEKRVALQDRLNRMEILAPQSGVVHQLAIHGGGAVITPAEAVLFIVPADEVLTVDARIAPHEIDQVHVGKPARLRFVAFNQRTTPEILAKITRVSADTIHDNKAGQSYFVVRLEVDEGDKRIVEQLRLVPGMPVEVYIATEERTAISYFLKPITDQFSRAFKER